MSGCERIAAGALKRDHPLLQNLKTAIVCFNRGHGAAMLREEVPLLYGINNPVSFMQIPYSKFVSLTTLISEGHEAGHVAMSKLGMLSPFQTLIRESLANVSASNDIVNLLGNCHKEIFADVWGTCLFGSAYASVSRDLLSIPQNMVLAINALDPHPTPFIRILLIFEICRQTWGRGIWDVWEKEIRNTYPLKILPQSKREVLDEQIELLPVLPEATLNTNFKMLGEKPLISLFKPSVISPQTLEAYCDPGDELHLRGLRPRQQLSLFRYLLDTGKIREEILNKIMVRWLLSMGQSKPLPMVRLLE